MSQHTLWPLAPHTKAKHQLLRAYLSAWFPILASQSKRLMYVDGFAGPGEYTGGEPGSPLISLEAAYEHRDRLADHEVTFLFIEQAPDRYRHLEHLIARRRAAGRIPANFKCSVLHSSFSNALGPVLDSLGRNRLAPTFVMIDPFGIKDVTYRLIQRLAEHEQTELLVSFMYEPITRFLSTDEFEPHLDALFGLGEWRAALEIDDPERKSTYLHDLFRQQLARARMNHVRSFRMIDDGGRTEYFLFFATHHMRGLEVMKDVMWSIDPSGGYRFSDATDPNQLVLFQPEPDFGQLRSAILTRFEGLTVGIQAIEEFVTADTSFRKAHIRNNALKPLEAEGRIEVAGRKRKGTYPVGCRISFE